MAVLSIYLIDVLFVVPNLRSMDGVNLDLA